jgi:cell division protein FtsZ
MTLHEATQAARIVSDHADDDAEFIFGAIIDDNLGEEMKVTVIAAGFDSRRASRGRAPTARTTSWVNGGSDDLDIPNFVQG